MVLVHWGPQEVHRGFTADIFDHSWRQDSLGKVSSNGLPGCRYQEGAGHGEKAGADQGSFANTMC